MIVNLISLLVGIAIIKVFNLSLIRFILLILLPMFLYEFYFQVFVAMPMFDVDFSLMYMIKRMWKGILYLLPTLVIFAILSELIYKKFFSEKALFLFIVSMLYLFTFEFAGFNFNGNIISRISESFVPLSIIGAISGILIYILPSIYKDKK